MNTTTTTAVITVDLMRPTINTIHVKQFDALSRFADIKIVSGGQPWGAGTSITYVVQYSKPDGTKGMYDKLPDGSTAVTSETDDTGSTVLHVRFAPQMFTVHGNVRCSVAMIKTDGLKLQTFSFCIHVEESDVNGDTSKDYYKMTTIDILMESIGDLSNLGTAAKENIVAAINEVLGGIPKDYVKSVNNVRPQANGDLLLYASDIDTQLPSISYQGSVEGALEAILSMPALPIARGTSADGIAYTATDDASGTVLPTVSVADNNNQISAVGKGRQIVFVPEEKNLSTQPTLQLNGGEIIPIRLRAPTNRGSNDQAPDATLPVPVGALMRGVPYTLTFCGKYWLVDSQIVQYACVVNMTKNADGTYTADKTFDALKAAHDAGKTVICRFNDLTQQWWPVMLPLVYPDDTSMGFAAVVEPEQGNMVYLWAYINKYGMGHTATEIATNDTVSTMIAAAIGDTAAALSDMDSVIGGAGA